MKKTKLFTAVAAALGMGLGMGAQAAPQIGINLAGTGPGGGYIPVDSIIQGTDTGTDINITGGGAVPAPGEIHEFHQQATIGTAKLGGGFVTLPGLNSTQELTKISNIADLVTGFTTDVSGKQTVTFGFTGSQPSIPTLAATVGATLPNGVATASVQMAWFVDNLADGSGSIAGLSPATDAGNKSSVRCYGTGDNTGTGTGCGTGGDADGTLVLAAKLVDSSSTFTFDPATNVGNGQFTLTYEIVYNNTNYIDLSNPTGKPILFDTWTGTLALPLSTQFPQYMQDGTPSATNIAANGGSACTAISGREDQAASCIADGKIHTNFKVDGSQFFSEVPVPEPTSLALLGAGLLGFGGLYRRKKS